MSDERSLAEQWRDAPWTVKAYAALTVIAIIANSLIIVFDSWRIVGSVVLSALFIYGLVRGAQTAWAILLILEGFAILSLIGIAVGRQIIDEPTEYLFVNVPIRVLNLFVLLHPLTRAWLRPQRATSAERLRKLGHPDE